MKLSRTAVLLLATGTLFFTAVAMSSYSLFMPAFIADYGWSRAVATLPFTVAMVSWGIFSPISGKLLDDYGIRPVILIGVLSMALGYLIMGLAQSLFWIIIGYGVLVGMAYGASGTTVVSILISKHFPAAQRASAVGFSQMANPANPLVMAPVIFWLINSYSWHTTALAISGSLVLVAFPLAWFGAREPELAAGAAAGKTSMRESLHYFRDPYLLRLIFARFACGLTFFIIAHMLSIATHNGLSQSVGAVGISIYGGSAVIGSLLAGKAADRFGRGRVLGMTYFLRALGTIGLGYFIFNDWSFYLLIALAAGPIFGTIAVNNVMIFEFVGPRAAGMVLGLSFVLHQLAAAIAPLLGGIVYDLTGNYSWFLLALGLIVMSAGITTVNLKPTVAAGPAASLPAGAKA